LREYEDKFKIFNAKKAAKDYMKASKIDIDQELTQI